MTTVLLIDDDADFRHLIRHYLTIHASDVSLVDYDSSHGTMPGRDFQWDRFDLILLDYQLGGGEDGLAWLPKLRSEPSFPVTVMLTGQGNEYVAAQAIKLGAEDYLRKQDLTAERLIEVISDVQSTKIEHRVAPAPTETLQPLTPSSARALKGYQLLKKIGSGSQSEVHH